ncbi:hypothetical protein C8F04DRAFT_1041989 [Mycena alexandri]|uniref:Uncharacterized protein n=1 Tax=Mycena alexandri TaxID=1745969 RepID=A0AAD6SNB4_9AGAR|nr:hypothetical protein C8F04DRAFT_1041989 [Mycena alexandri]
MTIAASSLPPIYCPPCQPTPCYSEELAYDETRLDAAPLTGAISALPTGIFTRVHGPATVVLFNQDNAARIPTYGKRGSVRGTLIMAQERDHICEVTARLEGRMEITTAHAGAQTTKTFSTSYSLWSSVNASTSAAPSCPETINFECVLPATFIYNGEEHHLPPSFTARFPGAPSLFANCTYGLTLSITKDRRVGFLSKTKVSVQSLRCLKLSDGAYCRIHIPIEYRPQTSPPRGLSRASYFPAAVKVAPQDWIQTSFEVPPRCSTANVERIQCRVFIPSVRVFGLADTIPVHLELASTLASLRELVIPSSSNTFHSEPITTCCPADMEPLSKSPLRAYLSRMVRFDSPDGKTTWRMQRIGAGTFPPMPPAVVQERCTCQEPCAQTLDWDGEISVDKAVRVGGFSAGGLIVRDFITLEIVPPNATASPLKTVQHTIPIRLVTETFTSST